MSKELMAELKALIALDIAEAQLQGSKSVVAEGRLGDLTERSVPTLDWLFSDVPAFEGSEKTLDPKDFGGGQP